MFGIIIFIIFKWLKLPWQTDNNTGRNQQATNVVVVVAVFPAIWGHVTLLFLLCYRACYSVVVLIYAFSLGVSLEVTTLVTCWWFGGVSKRESVNESEFGPVRRTNRGIWTLQRTTHQRALVKITISLIFTLQYQPGLFKGWITLSTWGAGCSKSEKWITLSNR